MGDAGEAVGRRVQAPPLPGQVAQVGAGVEEGPRRPQSRQLAMGNPAHGAGAAPGLGQRCEPGCLPAVGRIAVDRRGPVPGQGAQESLAGGGRLFPPAGEARWRALALNALGDGLAQAATWNIRERYRPEGERSPRYLAYYERAIARCLSALEGEARGFGDGFGIGEISVAAALSYVDLRYPERDWRGAHPALGAWYARAAARPSMVETPLGPYAGPLQPPL